MASVVLIEAVTVDASLNLAMTALAVRVSEPIEEIQKPAIENLAPVVKINLTINREELAVKRALKNLNSPAKNAPAS